MSSKINACALLLVLSACAEPPRAGAVEVIVLDRDGEGLFELAPRVLELESISPLRTERFELVEGATLTLDGATGGTPLNASFASGPPITPLDYESLVAFTALYRYEDAYAFYRELGLGVDVPSPARFTVYVYPRVIDDVLPISSFKDNAAFSRDLNGFVLAREAQLQGRVPLSMNPNVAVHEMGHAVFHHLLVTTRPGAARPTGFWVRALNEGLADTFAIAATGNPDMLGDSTPEEYGAWSEPRDVSLEHTLTQELEDAAEEERVSFYEIGTLVARTFWLYAELTQTRHGDFRTALVAGAQLVFDALRTFDGFSVEHTVDFFDQLLNGLPADHVDRDPLCQALAQTFGLVLDRVEACR